MKSSEREKERSYLSTLSNHSSTGKRIGIDEVDRRVFQASIGSDNFLDFPCKVAASNILPDEIAESSFNRYSTFSSYLESWQSRSKDDVPPNSYRSSREFSTERTFQSDLTRPEGERVRPDGEASRSKEHGREKRSSYTTG